MNKYFIYMVRKEYSSFSYVTKVEKSSLTVVIYLLTHRKHTIKPNTNVLGRFLALIMSAPMLIESSGG